MENGTLGRGTGDRPVSRAGEQGSLEPDEPQRIESLLSADVYLYSRESELLGSFAERLRGRIPRPLTEKPLAVLEDLESKLKQRRATKIVGGRAPSLGRRR